VDMLLQRPTLPHEDVVDSHVVEEAEALEEVSTIAAEAEVIHSTSQRIASLHANCVARLITLFSSATSTLTQHTWERRDQQILHNPTESTQIGMPILVQQICDRGS
jgi:hypothetical protein